MTKLVWRPWHGRHSYRNRDIRKGIDTLTLTLADTYGPKRYARERQMQGHLFKVFFSQGTYTKSDSE